MVNSQDTTEPVEKKLKIDPIVSLEIVDEASINLSSFEGFHVTRILSNNEEHKSVAVEGFFDGKEGKVVAVLQKLPFNQANLDELFTGKTKLKTLFHNDVYFNQLATFPDGLEVNDIKANLIYPAEQKHIDRFTKASVTMICETPELYEKLTKLYVAEVSLCKQWIYNILDHKKEVDRIIFEDPDPSAGFIMIPDLKWTGEQLESLYVQALVHRRDISCLRDLTAEHLPLLENILKKGTQTILEKYNVPSHKLRVYIHYQPSFYHLHVHFSALSFEAPGIGCGKAHLLSDVINNVKMVSDYYQRCSMEFTLKDNHPLMIRLKENGYFLNGD